MAKLNLGCYIANQLIAVNCRHHQKQFWHNTSKLKAVQESKLLNYIRENETTRFGQKHHFNQIRTYQDYIDHVPLSTYETYQSYVAELLRGTKNQLTNQEVTLLEPTSGTQSGKKLIPYNEALRHEFMAGVKPWLAELYSLYPKLFQGSSYWSISPIEEDQPPLTSSLPIGFEDDDRYFGWLGSWLRKIYSVPNQVRQVNPIENFRYITCLKLLAASDLALISVWNPSFLTILMDYCRDKQELLIKSIFDGCCYWPNKHDQLPQFKIKKSKKRAYHIKASFQGDQAMSVCWPNLQLISCWTDGMSGLSLEKLQAYFPSIPIQGKGLLATEGIVSFPVAAAKGSVLAYQSHFYEFMQQGDHKIVNAHQLKTGHCYHVIITTGGGLYRYQLQDVIKVTGVYNHLPIIKFLGRNMTSDLVGEKLEETFVHQVLQELFKKKVPSFSILAPLKQDKGLGYCLFIQIDDRSLQVKKLALVLDRLLAQNPHYAYARKLGQLKACTIKLIRNNGEKQFQAFQQKQGMKIGAIKANSLYTKLDLDKCFNLGATNASDTY